MASTLYLPGLAEYGSCKTAFLRARELLGQKNISLEEESRTELSALRGILENNSDAVDFLKAEFGQVYTQVYQRLTDASTPAFLLDEFAADNGKKRLQPEWFDYWNTVHDGRVMASMGDLYDSFKAIKKMHDGTEQEHAKSKSLLFSLRDDFDWPRKNNWLISSTRPIYSGNDLNARIMQHYRCNRPELTKETVVVVPVYRGVPIEKIVSQQAGLAYLQALFDTQDGGEAIMQTMEFVSGKTRSNIVGWTAAVSTSDSSYTRATYPERAAGFDYFYGQFLVYGSVINLNPGFSRGVRR